MSDSKILSKKEKFEKLYQNSLFTSPRESLPESTFNDLLKQKYINMKRKEKVQLTRRTIHSLHGKHNTIQYKKQFNFHEKWQQQNEKNKIKENIEIPKQESQTLKYIKYINLFLYLGCYWIISIYRTFQIQDYLYFLVPIVIISQILDIVLKSKNQNNIISSSTNKKQLIIKLFLKKHWLTIILCLYMFLLLVEYLTKTTNYLVEFFTIIDFTFAVICYQRFSQLYSTVKLEIISSKYRNQLYLIQLFGKCCNIVHISSIALILASFVNDQLNWTINITYFNTGWLAKYIYSVYFSCTTVFTIGYGDIAPKNLLQIVVILIIQAIGVINLGFIFSEIGRILAKINEDQQNLLKNMYQTQKIVQAYKLPNSLGNQMKDQILHHDLAQQKLNLQQEENLLGMLTDDLRHNIIFTNQLHIIKHSIFFICNWSMRFQRKIANKLIRQTYKPQESLHQIRGQEKLYILTLGKLHILPCSFNKLNQITYQPIRKIQYQEKEQIKINTFGYSFLVSGLNVKLKAIAKDYSICYFLNKEDFIGVIIEDERDFQYFHEIKHRLQTSIIKQIWQAPKLADNREHYRPNIYFIIKKYKKQMISHQTRKYKIRRSNKLNFCIQTQLQEDSENQIMTKEILTEAEIQQVIERNKVLTVEQRSAKYNSLSENKRPLITLRSYKKKSIKKQSSLQNQDNMKFASKSQYLNNFDYGKNFSSYFKKFNMKNSIIKYNNTFCNNKETFSLRSISTIKPYDYKIFDNSQLSQTIFDKLANIKIIEK